ncbi:MAG: hypothetical protein N3A60_05940 [Thermanaerothrix sp.]|nr:hypothetical protein [Thermanaerothrix sp.]
MNKHLLRTGAYVALLLVLVGLGIGLGLYSQRQAVAAPGQAPSWQGQMLAQYTQTLAVLQDPEQRAFLMQKMAPLQTQEAARQQALARPAPTKPADPNALRPPEPLQVQSLPRKPGLVEGVAAPVSPDDFTTRNAWQGEVDGQWVWVYAGAHTYAPEQGALIVLPEGAVKEEWIEGPVGAGALRIIAAEDAVLRLEAENGIQLEFDVRARTLHQVEP